MMTRTSSIHYHHFNHVAAVLLESKHQHVLNNMLLDEDNSSSNPPAHQDFHSASPMMEKTHHDETVLTTTATSSTPTISTSSKTSTTTTTTSTTTTRTTTTTTTRAVIHMGPHKTGTTSIQYAAYTFSDQLQQDGFDTVFLEDEDNEFTRAFSSCFLPPMTGEAKMYPCNFKYLLAGSTIASQKRNLYVSAEDFSAIGTAGDPDNGVDQLHAYLSQWEHVTIVVYYRHFFSYVASKYNQRMKNRSIEGGHYNTIHDYITQHGLESRYTMSLVTRLQRKFDNIVVMNMHNATLGTPAESFFCHALPFFEHTCRAIRSNTKKNLPKNTSVNLHHIHLIAGAIKAGLLSQEKASTSHVQKAVAKKVRDMESSLTGGGTEMAFKCLSSTILQDLWQRSLVLKRALFPTHPMLSSSTSTILTTIPNEHDNLTEDEKEMKAEFDRSAKTTLCMIDVDHVLSQTDWIDFFKSV